MHGKIYVFKAMFSQRQLHFQALIDSNFSAQSKNKNKTNKLNLPIKLLNSVNVSSRQRRSRWQMRQHNCSSSKRVQHEHIPQMIIIAHLCCGTSRTGWAGPDCSSWQLGACRWHVCVLSCRCRCSICTSSMSFTRWSFLLLTKNIFCKSS